MMIGLGIMLIALVIGFLAIRQMLADRLASPTTEGRSSQDSTATAGSIEATEVLPPVPERQNGSLSCLPDTAFARRQTVTVGVSDPFGLINPLYSTGDADDDAVALLFEPLLRLDQEGKPDLILAQELVPDLQKRTLSILLRPDHIWRDGRAVNATDVAFTYQCLLSASYDGPLKGRFADIQSVTASPKKDAVQSVVFTFKPGVTAFDYALLTVGILKSDYYAVPADKVYEIGRKALPPEGSGAFQWRNTADGKRTLVCREGYAGDIRTVTQVEVGSDDKYPLLLNGELDLVRHDWNARIESRTDRLLGYSFFKASQNDLYLMTAPDARKNGLPADPAEIRSLLLAAAGQTGIRLTSASTLTMQYFTGIEATEAKSRTAYATQIADRLRAAGQPVTLVPLSLPKLAENASNGSFQLMLLPAAADNRLPEWTVLKETRPDRTVNATVISAHPQIILVSARLANLTINPFGAPFAASSHTFTDRIANVRILNQDGSYLMKEVS